MEHLILPGAGNCAIHVVAWAKATAPRGVVQIAHGMGEHIGRYAPVAAALNAAGWLVYGNDHRGHGRTHPEQLGDMGPDGWNQVLADARNLTDLIKSRHPGLPVVLLGHSMGAMLAQQYVCDHGDQLAALVLSGTPGFMAADDLAELLADAEAEVARLGPGQQSELLQASLFGGFNEAFDGPDAIGFEWLSRDVAQVQLYLDDPFCGSVLAADSLVGLFRANTAAQAPERIAGIPESLPVYLLSGSDDPVHKDGDNLTRLLAAWQGHGLAVTVQLYPGGRHEMFNETNSAEVLRDLLDWLDTTVARA